MLGVRSAVGDGWPLMLDAASQLRTWRDALTVGQACDEAGFSGMRTRIAIPAVPSRRQQFGRPRHRYGLLAASCIQCIVGQCHALV